MKSFKHHSVYFGKFFLNLYLLHFYAFSKSYNKRTTFCYNNPNLSVPLIVTFYFFTSCNWFTRLQIYTQHPVELSFIIGFVGSSYGVTL